MLDTSPVKGVRMHELLRQLRFLPLAEELIHLRCVMGNAQGEMCRWLAASARDMPAHCSIRTECSGKWVSDPAGAAIPFDVTQPKPNRE